MMDTRVIIIVYTLLFCVYPEIAQAQVEGDDLEISMEGIEPIEMEMDTISDNFSTIRDLHHSAVGELKEALLRNEWKKVLSLASAEYAHKLMPQFGEEGPIINYTEFDELTGSSLWQVSGTETARAVSIMRLRVANDKRDYHGVIVWNYESGAWKFDGLPIPKSGVSDTFQLPTLLTEDELLK